MASTTTTKATQRGFRVACPKCGEGNVMVYLGDMDMLHCPDCSEDMRLDFIRQLVREWQPVLAWLDSAPELTEDE